MITQEVLDAINEEIAYAKGLGPDRVESQERPHTTAEYLTMLDTYLRRAQDGWTAVAGDQLALDEVRKVAAIAIRCMLDNGVVRRKKPLLTYPKVDVH